MIEHFKPAGHKAQELSEIVMPKEVFKPIQRVIDTTLEDKDKTIGYLYHDVEYEPGVIGSIVLSRGLLRSAEGEIKKDINGWQEYERDNTANPLKWFTPSAPVVLELCYRAQHDDTAISREVARLWHETLKPKTRWTSTSTILGYNEGRANVYHNWTIDTGITPVPEGIFFDLSEDNTPMINTFLRAILGQRYPTAKETLSKYGTPVRVLMSEKRVTGARVLVLGVSGSGKLFIDADGGVIGGINPNRGVSLLENFSSPRYKVRND
ncbi:TPA: hypothetical protein HA251_00735 [Candidatus Woesearchaeota archaeon]|nr:hypothetical protein [Candidatus Woesearchaeota archaeon]